MNNEETIFVQKESVAKKLGLPFSGDGERERKRQKQRGRGDLRAHI